MNAAKIGWIGLGKMGNPMSTQLIKAGHPLAIYNRTREKEASLLQMGATPVSTPAELIRQVDIVILMVSDDSAVKEIFTATDGLISATTSAKLIINMSTVSPSISRQMAVECSRQQNHYLDAPVSGSVKQAEDAQLVIMAGGEEVAFNMAKPVLERMGKLVMHIGATGAGNNAKLAINTLLALYAQGLAEVVLFARNNNIATTDLISLLNNGALGNAFTKIKGEAIINNNFKPAFALKHIVKDLRLAKDIGLNSPLANIVTATFQDASAQYNEEDIISIIQHLETNQASGV